jgi:hypothetical protein
LEAQPTDFTVWFTGLRRRGTCLFRRVLVSHSFNQPSVNSILTNSNDNSAMVLFVGAGIVILASGGTAGAPIATAAVAATASAAPLAGTAAGVGAIVGGVGAVAGSAATAGFVAGGASVVATGVTGTGLLAGAITGGAAAAATGSSLALGAGAGAVAAASFPVATGIVVGTTAGAATVTSGAAATAATGAALGPIGWIALGASVRRSIQNPPAQGLAAACALFSHLAPPKEATPGLSQAFVFDYEPPVVAGPSGPNVRGAGSDNQGAKGTAGEWSNRRAQALTAEWGAAPPGRVTWDCWKPVLRDASTEPSVAGMPIAGVLGDKRIAAWEMVRFGSPGDFELSVKNMWGDQFVIRPVLLPDRLVAAHATPV